MDAGGPPGGVVPGRAGGSGQRESAEGSWRAVVRVLRSPAGLAKQAFDDVTAAVLPGECRCCSGPLDGVSGVPVCRVCVGRVHATRVEGCRRCGEAVEEANSLEDAAFALGWGEGLECRECRMAPPEFDKAVAYGEYAEELRELVRLLKFERVQGVAKLLSARLAEAMLKLEGVAGEELLVVAVPLYRARAKERGYNQAALLAHAAVRRLRRMRPDWRLTEAHGVLTRTRATESLWRLSRRGRRQDLRGAFAVAGDVRGREVMLVDDVMTTGATMRECARVLRRAGAAKVWAVTVARAQKRGNLERAAVHEDVAPWEMTTE